MNHQNHPHDFENLEPPLDAAVQAVLTEPLPDEAVERVKTRAKQLATKPTPMLPRLRRFDPRKWKAPRIALVGFAIAAAVLIMVTGVTVWLDRFANRAFAQVIEKVKAAHTVRLLTATRFGQSPEIDGQMFLEGDRLRWEQVHGILVQVVDLDRKRAVFLDTQRKLAQEVNIGTEVARVRQSDRPAPKRPIERCGVDRRGDSQGTSHARLSTSQNQPARHERKWRDAGVG